MKIKTFPTLNLLIIFLIIRKTQSVKYHRSIYEICPQNEILRVITNNIPFRKDIELGSGISSSITIEQKWNSSSYKRFGSTCEFRVKSDDYHRRNGLFLLIRKLDLRIDPKTGECIDYVQIKFSDDKRSKQICGKIGPDYDPIKAFDDGKGRVKVYIFIDKFVPLDRISDSLELSLVFTSYSDCAQSYNPSASCFPTGKTGCIDTQLFDDGTVNCPTCLDEDGCFEEDDDEEPVSDNSGIIITAVTSLIFTIMIVASIFWLCFKFNSICCKPSNRRRTRRPVARDIELQTSPGPGLSVALPSAPPVHVSHSVVEDKDQPPPYDSLFPER